MRQVQIYAKLATDYEQVAPVLKDQALRKMYLKFAQQWREAAQQADIPAAGASRYQTAA